MPKRLLIMAGGTGGHVFPGLAVADELRQQGWEIHWLGTANRMEADTVPKAGYPISFIDIQGLRGNGLVRLLKAPFKITGAILDARKVIKEIQPDVVLGMGGYASGPGGIAAWTLGIPLVVHEQNAVPGMTNKLLARFAKRVLTGFANTFSNQAADDATYRWVGNPVRAVFSASQVRETVSLPLNILVVGGSLGAKALNDNVPQALAAMGDRVDSFAVRHQCGKGHLHAVEQSYQSALEQRCQWQVEEFIDDMARAFAWADLLICRAGALTVAEVAASGVCAIFVPLPNAVDDHQTKNAQALVSGGAAYLLPQTELYGGKLQPLLQTLLDAPEILAEKGRKALAFAKPDAALQVAAECQELAA